VSERLAWTGIVLAGGRSRRFGGVEKARLPLGGRTLLHRGLDALRPVTVEQLVVGTPPPPARGPAPGPVAIGPGARIVTDRYPEAGPLGGVLTGLQAASTSHVLVVACDLPFLTASFLAALQDVGAHVPLGLVYDHDGRMALCLTLRRDVMLSDAWAHGSRRMQDLLALLPHDVMPAAQVLRHDTRRRLLMNVNDPLTYAWALAEAEHN
jgi:molybdenum cofactor guanylyltransferase